VGRKRKCDTPWDSVGILYGFTRGYRDLPNPGTRFLEYGYVFKVTVWGSASRCGGVSRRPGRTRTEGPPQRMALPHLAAITSPHRKAAHCSEEGRRVLQRASLQCGRAFQRVKAGCSHDWLPHKVAQLFQPTPEDIGQVFGIAPQVELLQDFQASVLSQRAPELGIVHQSADGAR
jgi:hypothetical protein